MVLHGSLSTGAIIAKVGYHFYYSAEENALQNWKKKSQNLVSFSISSQSLVISSQSFSSQS